MSATAIQLNTPEITTAVKPAGVNAPVEEDFTAALADAQQSADASAAQTSTSIASVGNDSDTDTGTQTSKSMHEDSTSSAGKPSRPTSKKKSAKDGVLLAQPDASFLQVPPQNQKSLQTRAATTGVSQPVFLKDSNSAEESTSDADALAVATEPLPANAAARLSGVVDGTSLRTTAHARLNIRNAEASAERVLSPSVAYQNLSADCNKQPGENPERTVEVADRAGGASDPQPNAAQVISASDASTANDLLVASTHENNAAASGSPPQVVFAPDLPTRSAPAVRSDASFEPQLRANASTTEMPASHHTAQPQIGLERPQYAPENVPLKTASHESKDALRKVRDQAQTTDKHAHTKQHVSSRDTEKAISAPTNNGLVNVENTQAPKPTSETRATQIPPTSAAGAVADARPSQVLDPSVSLDSNTFGRTTVEAQAAQAVQKAESYPQVVQEAKLVQQLNGSEWHVRLQVPDLGHIDIRTSAREGATEAHLSVERADIHRMFVAGDTELSTALARHNIEFSGTTLFQSSTGSGAQQHEQAWQSPQQHHPAPPSGAFLNRESGTLEPAAQIQPGCAGRSLNILA